LGEKLLRLILAIISGIMIIKRLAAGLLALLGTATSFAPGQQNNRSWWLSLSTGQKVAVANGYLVGMDHASVTPAELERELEDFRAASAPK
jgi:hypothetical protein